MFFAALVGLTLFASKFNMQSWTWSFVLFTSLGVDIAWHLLR